MPGILCRKGIAPPLARLIAVYDEGRQDGTVGVGGQKPETPANLQGIAVITGP